MKPVGGRLASSPASWVPPSRAVKGGSNGERQASNEFEPLTAGGLYFRGALPVLIAVPGTTNLRRGVQGFEQPLAQTTSDAADVPPTRPFTAGAQNTHQARRGDDGFLLAPAGHVHSIVPIRGRGHTSWVTRGHGPRVLHEAHLLRRSIAFHSASSPDLCVPELFSPASDHAAHSNEPLGLDLHSVLSAVFAAPLVTQDSFPREHSEQWHAALDDATHVTGAPPPPQDRRGAG